MALIKGGKLLGGNIKSGSRGTHVFLLGHCSTLEELFSAKPHRAERVGRITSTARSTGTAGTTKGVENHRHHGEGAWQPWIVFSLIPYYPPVSNLEKTRLEI